MKFFLRREFNDFIFILVLSIFYNRCKLVDFTLFVLVWSFGCKRPLSVFMIDHFRYVKLLVNFYKNGCIFNVIIDRIEFIAKGKIWNDVGWWWSMDSFFLQSSLCISSSSSSALLFLSTLYVNGCMTFFCQCSICHLLQKQYFKLDFILLIVCRLDCVFFIYAKFVSLFSTKSVKIWLLLVRWCTYARLFRSMTQKFIEAINAYIHQKNWNVLDLNDESKSFYQKNAFKLFTSLSLSDLILGK